MSAAQYNDQVQEAYLAYYGRPADPAGLNFWEGQLAANNGNLNAIINAFGTSAESTALYGGSNEAAQINQIYLTLFGRNADTAGLNFYEAGLNAGTYTLASIALNVYNGAQGTDATELAAKLAYADAFTTAVGQSAAAQIAYSGTAASTAARAAVAGVTDAASEATAAAAIATTIADIGVNTVGTTFTLTTGVDNITLTGNNNVVDATLTDDNNIASIANNGNGTNPSTLTALDSITGTGTGNTLNIVDAFNYSGAPTELPAGVSISGIQTVNVQSVNAVGESGTAFDVSGFTGLQSFNVVTSTGDDYINAAGTTAVSVVDTKGSVFVTGGSTVSVHTDAGTSSVVEVTGAAGATTSVSVTGGGAGVYIQDANAGIQNLSGTAPTTVTANTIATVSVTGSVGTIEVSSDALQTLNLTNDYGNSVFVSDTTSAQTLNLNLSGVGYNTKTGAAAQETIVSSDGITSGTYTTAGATTLDVAVTGKSDVSLIDGAATALNLSGSAALTLAGSLGAVTAVTITGAAGLTDAAALFATNAVINASGSTGNDTLTLGAAQSYTGGSGANTITIGADASVTIAGGSGSANELILNNAASTFVAADTAANVSGFDILGTGANSSGSYDLSKFGSATKADVTAAGVSGITFTHGNTTQSLSIDASLNAGDTITLTQTAAAALATTSTLNLALGTALTNGVDTTAGSFTASNTVGAVTDSVAPTTAGTALVHQVSTITLGGTVNANGDTVTQTVGGIAYSATGTTLGAIATALAAEINAGTVANGFGATVVGDVITLTATAASVTQLGDVATSDFVDGVFTAGANTVLTSGYTNVDVSSNGAGANANAISLGNLQVNTVHLSDTALATLVLTGTESVTVVDTDSAVSSINTSGIGKGLVADVSGVALATSGVTLTGGAGAVHFTDSTIADGKTDTITAGDGNNAIIVGNSLATLHTGDASITLGNGNNLVETDASAGANTITVGNGNNVISVGSGANTITVGSGIDNIYVGTGLNVVNGGAGNDTLIISGAGANGNAYTTLNGAHTGDVIQFGFVGTLAGTALAAPVTLANTAVFQDYLNAAASAASTAGANHAASFQFGGNTFVVEAHAGNEVAFANGADVVVELAGAVNLTHATIASGALHLA